MVIIKKPGWTQDPLELFPYNTDITCARCHCIFRLQPGDAWKVVDDQKDGNFITTVCPQPSCRTIVTRDTPSNSKIADPRWVPSRGDGSDGRD